jgi:hypothetical protein
MGEIEREHRQVARGRDESTPLKALLGVHAFVFVVAGLLILAAVLIWVLLR